MQLPTVQQINAALVSFGIDGGSGEFPFNPDYWIEAAPTREPEDGLGFWRITDADDVVIAEGELIYDGGFWISDL